MPIDIFSYLYTASKFLDVIEWTAIVYKNYLVYRFVIIYPAYRTYIFQPAHLQEVSLLFECLIIILAFVYFDMNLFTLHSKE